MESGKLTPWLLSQEVRQSQYGFTLIELLVSILAFSALMYISALSFSMFLTRWNTEKTEIYSHMAFLRKLWLLEDSLESAIDYFVPYSTRRGRETWEPYFIGRAQSVSYVTLSPIISPGCPAVVRLQAEKDVTTGKLSLVYKEWSLKGTYLNSFEDMPGYPRSVVLIDGLEKIAIQYYGSREVTLDPVSLRFVTKFGWDDSYSGHEFHALPTKIKLFITSPNGSLDTVIELKGHNPYKWAFFNDVHG